MTRMGCACGCWCATGVHVTSYVANGYVYGLAVAASHEQRERRHQERCKKWSGEAGLTVSVCQEAGCELAWV